MKEIEIYKTENGTQVSLRFDGETFWLNQSQIAKLFGRERSVISKHINNIFKSKELIEKSNVQKMHITTSDKPVILYNLDVIISVGYRVNSKKGTLFRQWATQRLKDYLIQGYSINKQRLEQLQLAVQLIQKGIKQEDINLNEAKGIIEIIGNYTNSFILLNQYDANNLALPKLNEKIIYEISLDEAKKAIGELKKTLIKKKEATELFGNEKDKSFEGILGNIIQSFGGEYVYKSVEEQAAHLLYFIIKNHPFSDGNKRIGAFMFVWFLTKNKHHFKKNGELKINDNTLVALALLVAQSNPTEKELMVTLIINLINNR